MADEEFRAEQLTLVDAAVQKHARARDGLPAWDGGGVSAPSG